MAADILSLEAYRARRALEAYEPEPSKIDVMYDKDGNIYAGCYTPGPDVPRTWLPWQLQLSIQDARELGIRLLRAVEDAEFYVEQE